MTTFAIGEVAEKARIRASTIRYYEAEGVLPVPRRRSGKRIYDASVLDRLALIELAKECGFSIEEIRTFIHGFKQGTSPGKRWKGMAARKLEDVQGQIEHLMRMKELLEVVLQCKCHSMEICGVSAQRHRLIPSFGEVSVAK